jgi:hypothetical protein
VAGARSSVADTPLSSLQAPTGGAGALAALRCRNTGRASIVAMMIEGIRTGATPQLETQARRRGA